MTSHRAPLDLSFVMIVLLAVASIPTISPAAAPSLMSRTARHCFVALGTIKDYTVHGATYELLIVSPESPLEAALQRAKRAYPRARVIGYLNTMDMNDSMPHAAETLPHHEDWYLHDALGQRVRVRADRYKGNRSRFGMNVAKVGYQDFLADRAIEILEAGYDGLQLDNVETDSSYHPSRVGGYISGLPVELDRASWPEAERSMLARIHQRVAQAGLHDRLLIINQIRSGEPEVSRLYLAEVEGANSEGWLTRDMPHDGRFGWKARMDQASEVSRSGKILNLINRTSSLSEDESLYLFASYLLAMDGETLHFYHGTGYRPESTSWRSFYDIDIGQPTGSMSRGDGYYARPFTGGFVAVNPFDVPTRVQAPAGMVGLSSNPVEAIALQPKSAVILKRSTSTDRTPPGKLP